MKAELVPIDGGEPIPITKDITVIGRREFCDVQLDDPSLSKRHCVVIKTDGLLMVRDLASTNGTRVKGQLIRWAALLPNDRISFGKVKFRVFLGPIDSDVAVTAQSAPNRRDRPGPASVNPPQTPTTGPPGGLRAPLRKPDLNQDRPEIDLNDSRWFDQVKPVGSIENIFDLD